LVDAEVPTEQALQQGQQAYDPGNDGGDFRGQPPARSAGRLFLS
jgi:hypothetical protein